MIAAAVAALSFGALSASAEVPEGITLPPPPAADAPAGSGVCAVPGATNAETAPLTNLAEHLRSSRSVRVLAIGSSSTAGLGASSIRASYPAQLEGELEQAFRGLSVDIVNRGVSGEVAAMTARRLRLEVALLQPELVVWQVGTNDALARVSPEEFGRTITSTLRWLRQNDTDVVLVGLQFTRNLAGDPHYLRIKETLREVAQREGVPLVRRFEAMQYIATVRDRENMLSADEFHLNDLGYRCMAEHVARAIVSSVFLPPAAQASGDRPAAAERR